MMLLWKSSKLIGLSSFPSGRACLSSWSESWHAPRLVVDLHSEAEDEMSAREALLAWGVSLGVAGTTLSQCKTKVSIVRRAGSKRQGITAA